MKNRSGIAIARILVPLIVAAALVVAIVVLLKYDGTGSGGNRLSSPFVYDIGEMAKIDPNLIMYKRESLTVQTGFAKSHCLALDSAGTIYVTGDKAVRVFSPAGAMLREVPLGGEPRPVTIDEKGQMYVGLRDHVEVYDAKGERMARWKSLGERALLTGLAVKDDDVFLADAGNRIVLHYDSKGTLINKIGEKDQQRNIPGFFIPTPYFDLTVAPDGLLRVVNPGNHKIEAYTYEGDMEFTWGKFSATIEGFCGCCNPVNIAILPDESFVTMEKGLIRAKVYDPDGEFVGVVAGPDELGVEGPVKICQFPEQCQSGGFDVAVDAKGRIFVLDTIKNVVRVFSRKDAI